MYIFYDQLTYKYYLKLDITDYKKLTCLGSTIKLTLKGCYIICLEIFMFPKKVICKKGHEMVLELRLKSDRNDLQKNFCITELSLRKVHFFTNINRLIKK